MRVVCRRCLMWQVTQDLLMLAGTFTCNFRYHEGYICGKTLSKRKTLFKHLENTHTPCSILMPDGRACQRHEGDHHDHDALTNAIMPANAYPGTPTSNGGGTSQFTPIYCFVCPEDGGEPPYCLWSLSVLVSRIDCLKCLLEDNNS